MMMHDTKLCELISLHINLFLRREAYRANMMCRNYPSEQGLLELRELSCELKDIELCIGKYEKQANALRYIPAKEYIGKYDYICGVEKALDEIRNDSHASTSLKKVISDLKEDLESYGISFGE